MPEHAQQFTFTFDPAAALDELIVHLLRGFDATVGVKERELLARLRYHKGAANPIKLDELAAALHVSDRAIKQLAKTLTEEHGIPVGARREPPYGYFLCVTPEDYAAARRPYLHEMLSLLRRLKALNPGHRMLELCGQLELAIQQERK